MASSFAVERISMAQLLTQAAADIPETELDAHFAGSYGIIKGQPKHTAVLRFTAKRARWVADVEVVEPEALRRMVVEKLREALEAYEKN